MRGPAKPRAAGPGRIIPAGGAAAIPRVFRLWRRIAAKTSRGQKGRLRPAPFPTEHRPFRSAVQNAEAQRWAIVLAFFRLRLCAQFAVTFVPERAAGVLLRFFTMKGMRSMKRGGAGPFPG